MQTFNLLDPEVHADPFPAYAKLCEHSPVAKVEPGSFYALSRHADVAHAFRTPALYSSRAFASILSPPWVGKNPFADSLLVMDPPEHGFHRAHLSRAFAGDMLERLTPVITRCAAAALDAAPVQAGESFDAVTQLGRAVSGGVIAEALALPTEMIPKLAAWIGNIARITPVEPEPELAAEIKRLLAEYVAYVSEVVDARIASPGDDLPSELCTAEVEGRRLTRDEAIAMLFVLGGAGFESTLHLIAKSVLMLGQRPDLHDALRKQPELCANFVEEMLRFDGPIHSIMRITTQAIELHGETIPPHSVVALMMAAANRDPAVYDKPDHFDLHREAKNVLAFGYGPHICVAAALARLEAKLAITALVERYARVELVGAPQWNIGMQIRGLAKLDVRLHRSA